MWASSKQSRHRNQTTHAYQAMQDHLTSVSHSDLSGVWCRIHAIDRAHKTLIPIVFSVFAQRALVKFCCKQTLPDFSFFQPTLHINHVRRYTALIPLTCSCIVFAWPMDMSLDIMSYHALVCHWPTKNCISSCLATILTWDTQTNSHNHPQWPSIAPRTCYLSTSFTSPSLPIPPQSCQGWTTQPRPPCTLPHDSPFIAIMFANPRTLQHDLLACLLHLLTSSTSLTLQTCLIPTHSLAKPNQHHSCLLYLHCQSWRQVHYHCQTSPQAQQHSRCQILVQVDRCCLSQPTQIGRFSRLLLCLAHQNTTPHATTRHSENRWWGQCHCRDLVQFSIYIQNHQD